MAALRLKLIVPIAISAVVGITLWLVIDPPGQIRRVIDRQLENRARNFLTAVGSYYKELYEYPWDTLGQPDPVGAVVQEKWLRQLSESGFVDGNFVRYSRWEKVYITQQGEMLYACFSPLSTAFKGIAEVQGWKRDGSLGCQKDCFECLVSGK